MVLLEVQVFWDDTVRPPIKSTADYSSVDTALTPPPPPSAELNLQHIRFFVILPVKEIGCACVCVCVETMRDASLPEEAERILK